MRLVVRPQKCGTKWSIYEDGSLLKIATFQSEFEAYSARRAIANTLANSSDKKC